ncbi:hypothetical protein LUZ63_015110 [Rhynchospora breviuscula]|uniref:Uncharacterized protein n=1 Tax=Rhynchospora breviuscula TaxID=2022672 RepID=A0A9Q0CBR1_9POAL|nr:hypothetical protein LUZ63_015110 [Rhynchospora breviuscula]
MAQQMIESNRQGAEVCTGHDMCMKKVVEILAELHQPRGLLPLKNMEEVGYNWSTGFLWLKQKEEITHNFKKIGYVRYEKEVTMYVEDKKATRMTGVKVKTPLMIWISLASMAIEDPEGKRLTMATSTGFKKSFPVSAFELEEKA